MIYKLVRKIGGVIGSLVVTVTGMELLTGRLKSGIRKAKRTAFYKRTSNVQVYAIVAPEQAVRYLVYDKGSKGFFAPKHKSPYIEFTDMVDIKEVLKNVLESENQDMLEAHLVIPAFRKLFNKLVKQAEPSIQGKTIVWKLPEISMKGE